MKTKILLLGLLSFFSPYELSAQKDSLRPSAEIIRYDLKASVNEKRQTLIGEADVWVRLLQDSVERVIFSFPRNLDFGYARDSLNKKIDKERLKPFIPQNGEDVAILLPDTLKKNDTFFVRLQYEALFDSASTGAIFVNERELLLRATPQRSWAPLLSPASNNSSVQRANVRIQLTLAPSFIVATGGKVDTLHLSEEKILWRIIHDDAAALRECFLLCASKAFVERRAYSRDSTASTSFFTSPALCQQNYIDSLTHFLESASEYSSSLFGNSESRFHVRFAVVGSDDGSGTVVRGNNFIVVRNAPTYEVFDSAAFTLSSRNPFLQETMRSCCPPTADSTYLFDAGLAGYLATRFILDKAGENTELQKSERLDLLTNTLNFYPSHHLGAGRKHFENEPELFSNKGRYIFLMLEHILGRESFDSVLQAFGKKFNTAPVSLAEFQSMCEERYGSSLSWFFTEWLGQSGFPEFILSSRIDPTDRGSYEVNIIIEQRGDIFAMPLNLFFTQQNRSFFKRIFVNSQKQNFSFVLPVKPSKIELDPSFAVLRWIPQVRILAHARTAAMYRIFARDTINSIREALTALQLDPSNSTGTNALALFSLAKAEVLRGNLDRAAELFLRASQLGSPAPDQLYSLLSLIRLGNVLEMQEKGEEAVSYYESALAGAMQDPVRYSPAIVLAQKYLNVKFISSDETWWDEY